MAPLSPSEPPDKIVRASSGTLADRLAAQGSLPTATRAAEFKGCVYAFKHNTTTVTYLSISVMAYAPCSKGDGKGGYFP